jgi:Kdo2-lipid IVA lauroyltransferase/acyltransferase
LIKRLLAQIFIITLYLLSWLPLKPLRKIARYVGIKLIKYDNRTINTIHRNIELCFPHWTKKERDEFVQKRLACMGQTAFEMSHLWLKPVNKLTKLITNEFTNDEFKAVVKDNESIIVLVPHIGNWEMTNIYLSQFRQVTAMFKPLKNSTVNRFVLKARERAGSLLLPTTGKGMGKIIKALQQDNGLVIFLPDQVPSSNTAGVFAPLFGHEAFTMTLAHKLALKTKARVFIGAAFQRENGFAVSISPISDQFYSALPEESSKALNQDIERVVLEAPAQYQWEYKRYRAQPNKGTSLYK